MTAIDVAIEARSDETAQEIAIPARSDSSGVAAAVMTRCSASTGILCLERQPRNKCH
jgi:hypothetical protein